MIKWGILGCGNIAHTFAEAVNKAVDGAELQSAAARDLSRAKSFAKKHKIPSFYGSYEELVKDPQVDAVYIATPHSHHKEHALLCLENGKAVVCEKPMAINAEEVSDMISAARRNNLFLMEALWMRFLPTISHLKEVIAGGTLGQLRSIEADFSFKAKYIQEGRLFNPDLAGGALLDVGIYPLAFSLMAFNEEPLSITGTAKFGKTGVDESNSFKLEFAGEKFAVCKSAIVENGTHEANLEFDDGIIEIPNFWRGESLKIRKKNSDPVEIKLPFELNGFEYEIREAVECISMGKKESATMPLSESLRLAKLMDSLRQSWQMTYPMEVKTYK